MEAAGIEPAKHFYPREAESPGNGRTLAEPGLPLLDII
jgi:hypothetical protein